MNTDTLKEPPVTQLPASAREAVQHAAAAVKDAAHRATDAARETVQCATDSAKDACHTMSSKAEDTLVRSKEYVRQNPLPVVLGALALGAALGYMVVMTRRQEPTLRERFVDDPLNTTRDAIYAALAPVVQRLHEGYDSARDGAGRAMEKLHGIHPSRAVDSWAGQIGRVGSNLKFW